MLISRQGKGFKKKQELKLTESYSLVVIVEITINDN